MNKAIESIVSTGPNGLSVAVQTTLSDCTHHWVIESPHGPVSAGVCKLCNAEREFRNSLPYNGWEADPTRARHHRHTLGAKGALIQGPLYET